MNFKTVYFSLLIISLIIFFQSCGVKGPPTYPPGQEIPPWQNEFLKVPPSLEHKQNKEDQESN